MLVLLDLNTVPSRLLLYVLNREELQQPVFAAIDALEFPELHDESIPAISFLRHLGRLMVASGIRDFSVKVCCVTFFLPRLQDVFGT